MLTVKNHWWIHQCNSRSGFQLEHRCDNRHCKNETSHSYIYCYLNSMLEVQGWKKRFH